MNRGVGSHTMKRAYRILGFACAGAAVLYVTSYAVNSAGGGYESAAYNRLSWSPRKGRFLRDNLDALGTLYAPLIVLDRLLVHRCHVFPDMSFTSIPDHTLTAEVALHPREKYRREQLHRQALRVLRQATQDQEARVTARHAQMLGAAGIPIPEQDEELRHQQRILAALRTRLAEEEAANGLH